MANHVHRHFLCVYILLIFAYVLMSWVRLPYTSGCRRITDFLRDVCEPYLRLFRRVLPPLGPLDLSPVVAICSLYRAHAQSSTRSSTASTEKEDVMTITPVELHHIRPQAGPARLPPRAGRRADRRDRRLVRRGLAPACRLRRPDRAARVRARPPPRPRVAAAHDARLGRALRARAEGPGAARGRAHRRARRTPRPARSREPRLRSASGCSPRRARSARCSRRRSTPSTTV